MDSYCSIHTCKEYMLRYACGTEHGRIGKRHWARSTYENRELSKFQLSNRKQYNWSWSRVIYVVYVELWIEMIRAPCCVLLSPFSVFRVRCSIFRPPCSVLRAAWCMLCAPCSVLRGSMNWFLVEYIIK